MRWGGFKSLDRHLCLARHPFSFNSVGAPPMRFFRECFLSHRLPPHTHTGRAFCQVAGDSPHSLSSWPPFRGVGGDRISGADATEIRYILGWRF